MAFIKTTISDAAESENVPEGEYDLRCIKIDESKKSKKGEHMVKVGIKVEDAEYPNASLINHWLIIPNKKDRDADIYALMQLNNARFLECFNVPYEEDGFDPDDIVGASGRCLVTLGEPNDQDVVFNQLQLPRLSK